MSEGPGVLCLSQSTRRAQFFLQMDARQDVIITTQISSLLTKYLNYLCKIWKDYWRRLVEEILAIVQTCLEKRGIGTS